MLWPTVISHLPLLSRPASASSAPPTEPVRDGRRTLVGWEPARVISPGSGVVGAAAAAPAGSAAAPPRE